MGGARDKVSSVRGRVLIMDDADEHTLREAEVLNRAGYGVELARHGAEALSLCKRAWDEERPFDLVLLALSVSEGMGGIKTFKELLKLDHRIKAVISSESLNDTVIDNFSRYGFEAILFKPCSNQRLLKVVDTAISRPKRK